jgi:hypothetical protein
MHFILEAERNTQSSSELAALFYVWVIFSDKCHPLLKQIEGFRHIFHCQLFSLRGVGCISFSSFTLALCSSNSFQILAGHFITV